MTDIESNAEASSPDRDGTQPDDPTTVEDDSTETKEDVPLPPFSKLFGLARPETCMLIVAVILMIFAEVTGLLNPILISSAYDTLVDPDIEPSERQSEINQDMMMVIIIHFLGMTAGFFRATIMGAAGERVVARLRNQLYGSILKQEIAFFDEHKTGELVSRLGSDTTLIQQAISQAVPEVAVGVVKLIAAIALMFWLSPQLAGVTIGFTILTFLVVAPFGKLIGELSKFYQNILGEAQTRSTEALGAMRTVQSFTAEEKERIRYADKIGRPEEFPWWVPDSVKTTYRVGYWKSIVTSSFFVSIFGLGFGSMYFSLWYGFKLVNDGQMTLGDLTAFQSYIFQIGSGLAQTGRFITQAIEARGASGRVFQLLERTPSIPTPPPLPSPEGEESAKQSATVPEPTKPPSMTGAISFRDVSFSYPSRPNIAVLRNFTLDIPPNTTAALVGSSGAGKSTVVSLVQRFYDVKEGSILIDGHDIRTLDLQWMRSHIGYVQQEPQLFGLSVRENICYGLERDVSDEEIIGVSKEANAHDFIAAWPNGYDTLVGERGVKLSGGQKQRISIARALLVNPRILLLDEATSALDSESEALVQDAIEKAMVGRTVVIVAHRLSTITRAEQIVVVDDHEIADVGSHQVLMDRCPKYKDLIKRQSVIGKEGHIPRLSILEKQLD